MSIVDEISWADIIRGKNEFYRQTIHASQALICVLTWDRDDERILPNSEASFGRRMETSEFNVIRKNSQVTPDLVIQRSSKIGYVAEVKSSLPQNSDYWMKVVDQLRKYDDDLQGWWTEDGFISDSCVILLIEMSRSVGFKKYLLSKMNDENFEFNSPTSIIEYAHVSQEKDFYSIRTQWGDILDQDITERLENGEYVPIEVVIESLGEQKFCDAVPEPEYTMEILWLHLFNQRRFDVPYDQNQKAYPIDVNLDELTRELQQLYGANSGMERDVTFPKKDWVRDAMQGFVELGLAFKDPDDSDIYVVLFKRISGDIMDKFASRRKRKSKEETPKQLELFSAEKS